MELIEIYQQTLQIVSFTPFQCWCFIPVLYIYKITDLYPTYIYNKISQFICYNIYSRIYNLKNRLERETPMGQITV